MENLSVEDVAQFLLERNFPQHLITRFEENYIDGYLLMKLMDDFSEFQNLVPQAGLRMRLKELTHKYTGTPELVKESLLVANGVESSDHFLQTVYNQPILNEDMFDQEEDENVCVTPSPSSADIIGGHNKENIPSPPVTAQLSKRLPKQCPLPSSFTPSLSKSIEEKKISGNVKLCLIRESCEFYYSICPNPTPVEYQVMAKTLCDQYPELKNKLPVNGAYWYTTARQMSQKFRNFRRKSSPQVTLKSPTTSKKLVTIHHAKPRQFLAIDQSKSIASDTVAYKRSSERLISEFSRKSASAQLLDQLLRETFLQRRKDIEDSQQPTRELFRMYPFFASEKLVLLELSLIRDCDEVEQLVFSGWEKYYPKILNISKAPQTDSEYHALIIIDKKLRPNGSRNSAPAAFSFHKAGTPLEDIFKEKVFPEPRLVIFTDPDHPDSECQALIVAESTLLFKIDLFSVRKGLLILIALYYIYDINYPNSCPASGLLLFVQELLLGAYEHNLKKPAKYTQFIDSIIET